MKKRKQAQECKADYHGSGLNWHWAGMVDSTVWT
jgi:hypothetical protein